MSMKHIIVGWIICTRVFVKGETCVYINGLAGQTMMPVFRTKEEAEHVLCVGCKTEKDMIVKRIWVIDPGDTNE